MAVSCSSALDCYRWYLLLNDSDYISITTIIIITEADSEGSTRFWTNYHLLPPTKHTSPTFTWTTASHPNTYLRTNSFPNKFHHQHSVCVFRFQHPSYMARWSYRSVFTPRTILYDSYTLEKGGGGTKSSTLDPSTEEVYGTRLAGHYGFFPMANLCARRKPRLESHTSLKDDQHQHQHQHSQNNHRHNHDRRKNG